MEPCGSPISLQMTSFAQADDQLDMELCLGEIRGALRSVHQFMMSDFFRAQSCSTLSSLSQHEAVSHSDITISVLSAEAVQRWSCS